MAARTKRTTEELRKISDDHLLYEIGMLAATARLTAEVPDGPCRWALLESFTVHARVLSQFFFPTNAKDGDVFAVDYFADPIAWKKILGRCPKALEPVNRRVGEEIAHLTYARSDITPEAKGWNVPEIYQAITTLVETFRSKVAAQYLGPRWSEPLQTGVASSPFVASTNATSVNTPCVPPTWIKAL